MKAYWYDNKPGEQREPHDSGRPVSEAYLSSVGIIYRHCPQIETVDALAKERGYVSRDEISISPETMGESYEPKVKMFFTEHLHEDEEIRYMREGAGYFDIRGNDDEWVRIKMERDDLIILPAGIYHRFTTDENNYVKVIRLFQEEPKWTPLNRGPEVDGNPHRKTYLGSLASPTVTAN